MVSSTQTIRHLSELAWREVCTRSDKRTGEQVEMPATVAVESSAPHVLESRFATDFPALRHLSTALGLAGATELLALVEQFAAVVEHLRWSQNPSYDESNCSSSFLEGYAYAAFSGPDGPVQCAAPRGGMMLMGPNVHYVDHRHAPREAYLVMTPGSQWRLDEGEWFDVVPGDLIVHDEWQMHAMRTRDLPLLAFAGWMMPGSRAAIELHD